MQLILDRFAQRQQAELDDLACDTAFSPSITSADCTHPSVSKPSEPEAKPSGGQKAFSHKKPASTLEGMSSDAVDSRWHKLPGYGIILEFSRRKRAQNTKDSEEDEFLPVQVFLSKLCAMHSRLHSAAEAAQLGCEECILLLHPQASEC